ncbi:O-succinylbenzoate-CoA ligase [Halopolyspora algeriensis]|uniref:O-succinylbenzoate-CoA ligase n=1 Tax=Halopolyspora algeriensis TaxID=1500506 RepID=A0A368VF12_9ACTN|nr:long-chain fatty acid--CoA ligase [Halopolyspora algeriensis]RCW39652.1 O-succinylbenzoate-CoA ligase [Halopolyspora algeriensis]TQM54055.1 O-succinylbenzoate-CoA ligase [Halopolyspora algeriensis]
MDDGIGYWLTRRAFLSGERPALVSGDRHVTYGEFDARVNALARGLADLGVRRFDRVGMLLLNSCEFMETLFACAKLGAICVPINVRLASSEVGYILADAGADVLVLHEPLAAAGRAALDEPGVRVRHTLLAWGAPVAGESAYEDVVAAGETRTLEMDVDASDVHAIMYTSGTTGRPKGAMLTHANTIANARNATMMGRGLREDDVTITAAPMFHIGGLGVHSLPFVYVGATNVVVPRFDPAEMLAMMAAQRVSVQFLVPAMWAALMRVPDFDSHDLSSLELAVSGGAPCPLPVIEFFQSKGVPFQEGFGMTETAPAVSMLDKDHVKEKSGSIGRPLFHVGARIVDEDDRDVAPGVVGELVLRGDNIFAGYWMLPEATAEAFRGGWFHTGDLGRVDEDGFITLVDRKKDMIISGGENVYPVEVEQVLARHPAVSEAAVIGLPDETWGESVAAVVSCEAGAETDAQELIAFARERLAHFKCPRHVEFVDELPRNATGKVLKTELRR